MITNYNLLDNIYALYIQSLVDLYIDFPFQYWVNTKSTHPLVYMALDIFSIPAMSADPECLFLSSKHLL